MIELMHETIWFDQRKYEEAESLCYYKPAAKSSHQHEHQTKQDHQASAKGSSIVDQIAKARETIQQTLKGEKNKQAPVITSGPNVDKRLDELEKENKALKEAIKNINLNLSKLEARVNEIDISKEKTGEQSTETSSEKVEAKSPPAKDDDDDDDDDLFGSDDDDDGEVEKLKQKRVAEYEAKKAKKPAAIAKSNIILDVKPWDDETDMAVLEEKVRSITCEGLLWGKSKLVPVGYGIKKLQISCVVEDDKCGTEYLEEEILKFDNLIQSMDVAAFNKV